MTTTPYKKAPVSDDPLSARVLAFTARQLGLPSGRVRLQSRLLEDLGLDGDDAAAFMTAFAREFAVDLQDFPFSRHFGPEGMPLRVGLAFLLITGLAAALTALITWWVIPFFLLALAAFLGYLYKKYQKSPDSAPASLQVLHLVQAATARRWTFC